jgi:tRNA A-37 threonylcarbamoyl transferase component Bud32
MATLSPSELLDWLGQNQFLSGAQTDELRPLLGVFPDSLSVAKELMRRDWLTPYQVNQVMQGKHDRLVLDCYRLRERIGEGAMGQVFKAWSLRLERLVAVKTIAKELINNDKAMERFRREVETASQLDHPNIALVRDAGEGDGRPFLVMDFIEGIDLSRRVKQQGALAIREAVDYCRQAALGLQYAFERGIVHRDIKPANLMVTTVPLVPKLSLGTRPAPLVKILDFGLARYESERENDARLTQVGKLLGTIDYIAPEQAQDARGADIRADIYSLGCSLFFMLAAQAPFQGKDIVEKLGPRLTGEPPWIRPLRAEVPPGLEDVVRKMMARRPQERYQTPIEAAHALQAYADAPIAAAIALARPVTAPASAGVVMAIPVPANAIVPPGKVPMAMPVGVCAPTAPVAADVAVQTEPAREQDPAFLGMTATGRDMSSGSTAAAGRAAEPKKPFPVKLAVILGGGAFLLSASLCLGVCLLSYFPSDTMKKSNCAIYIKKAMYSVPSQKLNPGESKFVNVYIERVNFKGPVKISLEDLPDGVTSKAQVMPESANEWYVGITVRFLIDPIITKIRVHAECEAEGISADRTIPLVIESSNAQTPKKTETALRITKAVYSVPDQKLKPGDTEHVNVSIERVDFKGEVKITLLDLPDGVSAGMEFLAENITECMVAIAVRDPLDPITAKIRVRAECQAAGLSAELTIPLVIESKQ